MKTISFSTDIVIDDEQVTALAAHLRTHAEDTELTFRKYRQLLKELREYGIMEGETAKALDAFIEVADELAGVFRELGGNINQTCRNYITIIDKADEYLY